MSDELHRFPPLVASEADRLRAELAAERERADKAEALLRKHVKQCRVNTGEIGAWCWEHHQSTPCPVAEVAAFLSGADS